MVGQEHSVINVMKRRVSKMTNEYIVWFSIILYISVNILVVFFFGEKIKPLKFLEKITVARSLGIRSLRARWFMQRFLTIYLVSWLVMVALFIIVQLGRGLAYLITAPI